MLRLNPRVFETMVRGSSVYATGGGLELGSQMRIFNGLPKTNLPRIVSLQKLDGNSLICCVSGIGSAGKTDIKPEKPLRIAAKLFRETFGANPAAVFPVEANIDALSVQAASILGIPLLDADSAGGRAVPEVELDNFFVFGKSILPNIVVSMEGDSIIIRNVSNISKLDLIERTLSKNSNPEGAISLSHAVKVRDAMKILSASTFTRSYNTGLAIEKYKGRKDAAKLMVEHVGGKLIMEGVVREVNLKNSDEGFLTGHYEIKDVKGNIAKIQVKNENIICLVNSSMKVLPPDHILTIDKSTLLGVHNSKIRKGMKLLLVERKADKIWSTAAGRRLFNYKKYIER